MRLGNDPLIYWIDLENDKIRINCDDDLRFFLEESKIQKLIFEFEKLEPTRKRPQALIDDNADYSKRLRTKMEQIDLTDSSSMELSDTEDEQEVVVLESVSSTMEEVPSTSCIDNEPRVKIISVDIIANAIPITEEIVTEQTVPENIEEVQQDEEQSSVNNVKKERKRSESNRIVISDSSDNEEEEEETDGSYPNRRFSDGNYNSSYSFANANNNRYDSRASFDDDFRHYNHHRRRREHFNEHARSTYRNCSDNMHRIFQQANSAREQAMRNFRDSANLLPDLLTTFQSRFGPIFQQTQQQPRFGFQQQQNHYRY